MTICFPFSYYKKKTYKKIHLIILGLDNAGKTTTTRSIKGIPSNLVTSTIGFDKVEFDLNGYNITAYDLGGRRTIREIWSTYFAEVHGVIYVIDSSAKDRLSECGDVLVKILSHPFICGKPILILINKRDLVEELQRTIQRFEQLMNEYQPPFHIETCCALLRPGRKLDKSILRGLQWLVSYIGNQLPTLNQRIQNDMAERALQVAHEQDARRERIRANRDNREQSVFHDKSVVHANGDNVMDDSSSSTSSSRSIRKRAETKQTHQGVAIASSEITVIDLENKTRTDAISTFMDEYIQRNTEQVFVNKQHEVSCGTTNRKLSPCLLKESSIDNSCVTIPFDHPKHKQKKIKSTIPLATLPISTGRFGDSIRIEELDEMDLLPTQIIGSTPSRMRSVSTVSLSGCVVRTGEAFGPLRSAKRNKPSGQRKIRKIPKVQPSPMYRLSKLSLENAIPKNTRCNFRPPNLVSPLYKGHSTTPKSKQVKEGKANPSPVSMPSSSKQPSPLMRLMTPNINKLHPEPFFTPPINRSSEPRAQSHRP